jgi:hypothetical protein
MQRLRLLALVLVVSLLAGSVGSSTAQGTGAAPSVEAKKKCKRVKRKVHGRTRTVRVCRKVRPAPTLPSKVSVTLDSEHAATASISAASGGSLTAGGVTLTVPAGAVSSTTRVTMTPVTRLGGLRGQVLGAVEFQPDGARLLKPVTLTIAVPSTSDLVAFSYAGNGGAFHLYPLKVDAGKATLELVHFSGYGVGEHLPGPSFASLLRQLNAEVKPIVKQAGENPAVFEQAVSRYSTWKTEVDRLAAAKRAKFTQSIHALEFDLAVALRVLASEQHDKCVGTHDVVGTGKAINHALDLLAAASLLLPDTPILDAANYASELRHKCESFELDFTSKITWTGAGHPVISDVRVKGLKLNAANGWTNDAPLDYWSFIRPIPPVLAECKIVEKRLPEKPFAAKLDPVDEWYDGGSPPLISATVSPGTAREERKVDCPKNSFTQVDRLWQLGFYFQHKSLSFAINEWEYVGQSVFARRTYGGTSVAYGDIVSEYTTFVLRHTPE